MLILCASCLLRTLVGQGETFFKTLSSELVNPFPAHRHACVNVQMQSAVLKYLRWESLLHCLLKASSCLRWQQRTC